MTHEGLARELREYARKADKLRDGWTLYIRAAAAIEILDRLCDGYEAENKQRGDTIHALVVENQELKDENQKLRKELDQMKESANVAKESATGKIKWLDSENERLSKSAGAYKEAAEIFQRKAYEEQKQREALDVENRQLKSQLTESAEKLSSMDTDLVTLMWHSGEGCEICAHAIKEQRGEFIQYTCALGSGVDCRPEWRGNREAE